MNNLKRQATTAERLKEALEMTGKKQADLVRETGINKGTISKYLYGRYEPKSEAINKMAVALNVSEMWLWGYDVPMQRTDMQKKNDAIADIIVRLRSDNNFLSFVMLGSSMSAEELATAEKVLKALAK